uniref:Transmembrane protein 170B n=1 Tax=Salvator merianae TaxID=96440 RepID=A0A8D0BHH0_SALMN
MSPPPRGVHPIRAPSAYSSSLGAWPWPPLPRHRQQNPLLRVPGRWPSSNHHGATGQVVSSAATMKAEAADSSMINLSVQQVLSLWAHGTSLRHLTGAAVAGIYRVAGKSMAPLEALVFGVGQTVLTVIISFSRILATL